MDAIASNTIASMPNILPTGFVVQFEMDRLIVQKKVSDLVFFLFIFDKMEKFKERGAVVKALKQSNQDTSYNMSIDDTVKFVYGHKEAFTEISRGNCITGPTGFKNKPC